jgi:hypothetical protein
MLGDPVSFTVRGAVEADLTLVSSDVQTLCNTEMKRTFKGRVRLVYLGCETTKGIPLTKMNGRPLYYVPNTPWVPVLAGPIATTFVLSPLVYIFRNVFYRFKLEYSGELKPPPGNCCFLAASETDSFVLDLTLNLGNQNA